MKRYAIATLLFFSLAVGGYYLWLQRNHEPQIPAAAETTAPSEEPSTDEVAAALVQEMAMGAEDAPITIVEYASFTCPHCARYHNDVFGQIVANYVDTGKVRFVMRDVYFDRLGLWAAMLARCDNGDRFFGVSDIVYETQHEWTSGETNLEIVQNLKKIGRLAGMDDAMMDACLQDDAMAQALVATYQETTTRDEVNSTPTFMINGKQYPNMNYADFAEVLDGLLAE